MLTQATANWLFDFLTNHPMVDPYSLPNQLPTEDALAKRKKALLELGAR